jgi:hypothetical protein
VTANNFRVLALLVAGCALPGWSQVTFPGTHPCVAAPNGRITVCNEDSNVSPFHALSLVGEGTKRQLFTYDRSVRVYWAPDSKHVAITVNAGSDSSFIRIFSTDGATSFVVDQEKLCRQLDSRKCSQLSGNGHVYIEAQRWLSKKSLYLKVHGYGEVSPKGFSFEVSYPLD